MKTVNIIGLLNLVAGLGYLVCGDDVVYTQLGPSISSNAVPGLCRNFSYGNVTLHEFYSPYYPSSYPNDTDCTQLLVGPKGSRIQLDFRDGFHIEQSPGCEYDYLEIRDGPFGYSPLIGKYCGQNHPPMIDSSNRFLWIRFKSDSSIEYRGFRAVYSSYRPQDSGNVSPYPGTSLRNLNDESVCKIDVDTTNLLQMGFKSRQIHTALGRHHNDSLEVDCTFVIYSKPNHNVYISWPTYRMTTENDCDDSFIDIYEGATSENHRTKHLCTGVAHSFRSTTSQNQIYMRVFAKATNLVPEFEAFVTIFQQGPCFGDMFDCGEEFCIDKSLVCNKYDNCNYRMDEKDCPDNPLAPTDILPPSIPGATETEEMESFHVIVLSIVGGAILVVIFISVCLTCKQHKNEQKRRKHALRQEERQAIEHEMTTLLNGSPRPGHLRAVNTGANAAHSSQNLPVHRVNGSLPGASGINAPSILRKPEIIPNYTGNDGIYAERNAPQIISSVVVPDSEYIRYIKQKDKNIPVELSQPMYFSHLSSSRNEVMADIPIHPTNHPDGFGIERSVLKRSLSDKGKSSRTRTPSPRPDVVQEERVSSSYYALGSNNNNRRKYTRTLSADILQCENERNERRQELTDPGHPQPSMSSMEGYLPYKHMPNIENVPGAVAYVDKSLPAPQIPAIQSHKALRKQYSETDYNYIDTPTSTVSFSNIQTDRRYKTPPERRKIAMDPGYRTVVTQLHPSESHTSSPVTSQYTTSFDSEYSPPPSYITQRGNQCDIAAYNTGSNVDLGKTSFIAKKETHFPIEPSYSQYQAASASQVPDQKSISNKNYAMVDDQYRQPPERVTFSERPQLYHSGAQRSEYRHAPV